MRCLPSRFLTEYTSLASLEGNQLRVKTPYQLLTQIPADTGQQEYWCRKWWELLGQPSSYVVLMKDWNVGSLDGGLVEIVNRLRASFGTTSSLADSPLHLFSETETELAMGLVRLCWAFQWGAYILPNPSTGMVIDHFDIYLRLTCADQERLEGARLLLRELDAPELPQDHFQPHNSSAR